MSLRSFSSPTSAVDDPNRLAALDDHGILDTVPEQGFDDVVRLATRTMAAPETGLLLLLCSQGQVDICAEASHARLLTGDAVIVERSSKFTLVANTSPCLYAVSLTPHRNAVDPTPLYTELISGEDTPAAVDLRTKQGHR